MSYVNIVSSGAVQVVFEDGYSANFSAYDPLIPSTLTEPLVANLNWMSTEGVSEIHMESDAFRSFTHIVKGGAVHHAPEITNNTFAFVMQSEAQLKAALNPPE